MLEWSDQDLSSKSFNNDSSALYEEEAREVRMSIDEESFVNKKSLDVITERQSEFSNTNGTARRSKVKSRLL